MLLREKVLKHTSEKLAGASSLPLNLPLSRNNRGPPSTSIRTFPWRDAPEELKRWQSGTTGFPIVDAGMRELWHTGWMHNRVRMIVASFLVKNLSSHGKKAGNLFFDTLVDGDLASNTLGWQWAGGCGADAVYFRIFNPMSQSEKFDGEGEHIRKWVPEIASLISGSTALRGKRPRATVARHQARRDLSRAHRRT